VELRLTGHQVLLGDIHLQLVAQTHSGPESPLDMLNRPEAFFAMTLEGEQPVLLAKSQVVALRLPAEAAGGDPARESAARRMEMAVEFSDGTRLEGAVLLELPPDRLRLLDFLNFAPAFFGLRTGADLQVVNRSHVRAVSPLAQVIRGQA
jgi:hypothetical protein